MGHNTRDNESSSSTEQVDDEPKEVGIKKKPEKNVRDKLRTVTSYNNTSIAAFFKILEK